MDSGFLNHVFFLHTPFNNDPSDEIYLRQVKKFIHTHMYVYICKTYAIFSYNENIFERKSYSVNRRPFLFHICPVRMTGYSVLLKMNQCLFSCTILQETLFVCGQSIL